MADISCILQLKPCIKGQAPFLVGTVFFLYLFSYWGEDRNRLGGENWMKKVLLIGFMVLLAGCAEENPKKLDVKMFNADGDSLGTIKLQEQAKGLKLKVDLEGLEPGVHGIHIHSVGKCKAPDFKSAGNHYNPDDKEHGLLHPKGAHAGDLSNLIVKDSGNVKATLTAKDVTLRKGKTTLFTQKGTSIIVNQNQDDGMTQPAGDSGKRIACGVITKGK